MKTPGGGGGLVVVANTCKSACHSIRDLMLNIGRKFIVTIHDQYERPSPASMRTQTVHGSRVRQYVLLYHHRHLFYKHKSLPSLHQLLYKLFFKKTFVDTIAMVSNHNFTESFCLELLEKMRTVTIFISVFTLVKK